MPSTFLSHPTLINSLRPNNPDEVGPVVTLILRVSWFCKLPKVTQLVWGGAGLVPGGP